MKLIILILLFSGLELTDNHYISCGDVEKYRFIAFKKPFTINMGSDSQLWIKQYAKGEGYIKGIGDEPARIYLMNDNLNAYNGLKFRGNLMVIYGECED